VVVGEDCFIFILGDVCVGFLENVGGFYGVWWGFSIGAETSGRVFCSSAVVGVLERGHIFMVIEEIGWWVLGGGESIFDNFSRE
jgi:hypothetical protein